MFAQIVIGIIISLQTIMIPCNAIESNMSAHYLAELHLQKARKNKEKKRFNKAYTHYAKAINYTPQNLLLFDELATFLKHLNLVEQAIIVYKQALTVEPQNINIQFSLANALVIANKTEEAIDIYQKILTINPDLYPVRYNYGFALKKLGFFNEAIKEYYSVLKQEPNYFHAHFSMALAYLTLGDFSKGFPEYEWRWEYYKTEKKNFDVPEWDGSNPAGKIIVIISEQGLGDSFQSIRYAKILHEMGARIIFVAQKALVDLFKLCPYLDSVTTSDKIDQLPLFDYYCYTMSLPLLFQTQVDTVPTPIPYIYPNETLVTLWNKNLSDDHNFKIGICWQGNNQYASESLQRAVAAKSVHVNSFKPISTVDGISLYSLQQLNGVDQLEAIEFDLKQFGPEFDRDHGRFMDTAALIKNLDLVITVDTSIAHLAGALGVPVWVILPYPADWRWMLDRTDTPWYPTMKLFRSAPQQNWESVIQDVKKELELLLHKSST